MPVCVVPAETELGLKLVRDLRAHDAQVHAYCRSGADSGPVRSAGAFVAEGELDDEGRLEATMAGVHTVIAVHADVTWPDVTGLQAALEATLKAAVGADAARIIILSVPAAAPGAADLLRDACGRTEELAESIDVTTLVVRASLIETHRLVDAVASMAPSARAAETQVAPIAVDDLVAGLVALDLARSQASSGHALFIAEGVTQSFSDYAASLVEARDLVGRTYLPADQVPLFAPSLAQTWVDGAPGAVDLWSFAGLRPSHPGS